MSYQVFPFELHYKIKLMQFRKMKELIYLKNKETVLKEQVEST